MSTLLSTSTLIHLHSASLVVASYLLVFSPSTLLNSTPIWLLGESMHIRPAGASSTSSNTSNEILALTGLVLGLMAMTQVFFTGGLSMGGLFDGEEKRNASKSSSKYASGKGRPTPMTASSPSSPSSTPALESIASQIHYLKSQTTWLTLSGLRILFMGGLAAWIYLFHSSSSSNSKSSTLKQPGLALLANRVVFTFATLDMLFWGYVWTVLREEGRKVRGRMRVMAEQREEDE